MQYAVVLYFNDETEKKLLYLMRRLVDSGMNSYMMDHNIPPHITISTFTDENPEGVEGLVESFGKRVVCLNTYFASIGVFNPKVIFLSPVMTDSLAQLNREIHDYLMDRITDFDNFYLPNQWVPHVALGVQMNPEELIKAFETIQRDFVPFGGQINRIALAKCNPYIELRCFKLQSD